MLQELGSATCNICNFTIRTEGSNTSGMVRHLRRYHPDVRLDQSSMPELSEADNDNDNDEFDWPIDPGTLEIKMEAETSEPRSKSRSKVWNYFERQVQFHSFFALSVIENRYRHLV